MTLNEVMTQIADAIREKTGKSEKIAPVNFAEEIKSISAGGGESGGSDWHYFDVSALDLSDSDISMYINTMLMMVRFEVLGKVGIGSAGFYDFTKAFAGGNAKVLAFGLDFTQRIIQDGVAFSYKEVFEQAKNSGIIFTEITEAEFYDLNA